MQIYRCQCGNSLFYDNSRCIACNCEAGYCPGCDKLVTLVTDDAGAIHCGNPECGAALQKCFNYAEYEVCNRCLPAAAPPTDKPPLCDCCRFNQTIPDLTVPGNLQRWYRLEAAKRRLFYDLRHLGLPFGTAEDGIEPELGFDFKADKIPGDCLWRSMDETQQVYTGHAAGRITINVREADDAEREKMRVDLGEAKRTLIGHFRHEIGHFYWDVLIKDRHEPEFISQFGDHTQPDYATALEAHYQNGPPADWRERFVSAYASMHPWEDFAETWALYLSMVSTLDTAYHVGFGAGCTPAPYDVNVMIAQYQKLGVALNELNRSMGLLDFMPEVFVAPVIQKIGYVHKLIERGRNENPVFQAAY